MGPSARRGAAPAAFWGRAGRLSLRPRLFPAAARACWGLGTGSARGSGPAQGPVGREVASGGPRRSRVAPLLGNRSTHPLTPKAGPQHSQWQPAFPSREPAPSFPWLRRDAVNSRPPLANQHSHLPRVAAPLPNDESKRGREEEEEAGIIWIFSQGMSAGGGRGGANPERGLAGGREARVAATNERRRGGAARAGR